MVERAHMTKKLSHYYNQKLSAEKLEPSTTDKLETPDTDEIENTILNLVPSESTIPEVPTEFPDNETTIISHPLQNFQDKEPSSEQDLSKYLKADSVPYTTQKGESEPSFLSKGTLSPSVPSEF
jgi:hypothetical protein